MSENEKEYFNKNYNLSYVDESLPKPGFKLIAKHIISSMIVYYFVYVILCVNPFFKNYINIQTKEILRYCLFGYMIIAPLIYFPFRPKSVYSSHNIHIVDYFTRCILNLNKLKYCNSCENLKQTLEVFKPTYYEKSSIILIFIKLFFGTLMLNFALGNINVLKSRTGAFMNLFNSMHTMFVTSGFSALKNVIIMWRDFIYTNLILILFTIDLSVYSFGYLTELSIFKNKIRTVETTIGGLFICIICYPPFVNVLNSLLGWNSYENASAFGDSTHWLTWTCRLFGIFFLVIYVAASVALGTKASNLTNRGTVSLFPYNIVRHPAYVSKVSCWIFQFLPTVFVSVPYLKANLGDYLIRITFACIAISFYTLIYYLRALTEERHLSQDPDYREYQKKVKWQFIPGII